jgi:hypothetical protein
MNRQKEEECLLKVFVDEILNLDYIEDLNTNEETKRHIQASLEKAMASRVKPERMLDSEDVRFDIGIITPQSEANFSQA